VAASVIESVVNGAVKSSLVEGVTVEVDAEEPTGPDSVIKEEVDDAIDNAVASTEVSEAVDGIGEAVVVLRAGIAVEELIEDLSADNDVEETVSDVVVIGEEDREADVVIDSGESRRRELVVTLDTDQDVERQAVLVVEESEGEFVAKVDEVVRGAGDPGVDAGHETLVNEEVEVAVDDTDEVCDAITVAEVSAFVVDECSWSGEGLTQCPRTYFFPREHYAMSADSLQYPSI
jgi:hypothetical protein